MSLIIKHSFGTLEAKTYGTLFGDRVHLADYDISMEDFARIVEYVLTNTDLEGPNDPRLKLLKYVKSMKQVKGYNAGSKRLKARTSTPPVVTTAKV